MKKIVFVNDENQTEYRDTPANVFDAVEHLMDTYSDIYSDINRDKIRKPNSSEIPTGSTTTNDIEVDYTINGLDDFIKFGKKAFGVELTIKKSDNPDTYEKLFGTTKNDLGVKEFVEIVVEYPPEDLCTYPEYRGKPYFSIKYEEGNDCIIGYGTYNPQVLSRYLKDYFMPTTKNDLGVDCISRQAVLDLIADYDLSMGQVVRGIHALPSVTPQEPRKGHWIEIGEESGALGVQYKKKMCSVCKWSHSLIIPKNACPNCGAKMVEPQESEDT